MVRKKEKKRDLQTYRNKIVDLLRVSRRYHYQKYFEENKKSSSELFGKAFMILSILKKVKKTNTPSSSLIDRKIITNPKDMAENFNNFFTSIGTKLQSNIPPTRKHYIDYLKHQNPETFFNITHNSR